MPKRVTAMASVPAAAIQLSNSKWLLHIILASLIATIELHNLTTSIRPIATAQHSAGSLKEHSKRSLDLSTGSSLNKRQQQSFNFTAEPDFLGEKRNNLQQNATYEQSGCSPNSSTSGDNSQSSAANKQRETYNQSFGYTEAQISDYVKPTFYMLRLKVDPTRRKFTGQLMIALNVSAPSIQQVLSAEEVDNSAASELMQAVHPEQSHEPSQVMRDKNGDLGHRYLTLNSGNNIHIKKAFYVYSSRGSVQIPATKIGKNVDTELLTLDFYPNVITSGQGLLLIVYTGLVNETESHGLFVHRSQRPTKRPNISSSSYSNSTSGNIGADDSGLATHMQPNFARRLFPSWDEPNLKARFSLIVVLPFRGYVTLSNMPVKKKTISLSCSGEPLHEIEFHTTPTMSTYLVALAIGRFDYVEAITSTNIRVRAYVYSNQTAQQQSNMNSLTVAASTATSTQTANTLSAAAQQQQQQTDQNGQQQVNNKLQSAQIALKVAVAIFDRLETLLGVRYPLNKFDMVALRDFGGGGMENWGASMFRESYLLYDNSTYAQAATESPSAAAAAAAAAADIGRQRSRRLEVPLVVAHEIAHQWFGNLVTCSSWTYLWLNEGFAQYLMYDLADYLFPQENYPHLFIEDIRQTAMHEDELITSSRPLEFELTPPSNSSRASSSADQLNLFDQITYNKGAMIVQMLYHQMGREHFYAGLHHYLLKHSYESVSSQDLWAALEESTGRPERQLETPMSGWVRQEGYPLISVQVFEEPTYYRLRLTQERFTLLQVQEADLKSGQVAAATTNASDPFSWSALAWSVHISISSEVNPQPLEQQLIWLSSASNNWQQQQQQRGAASTSNSNGASSRVNFVLRDKSASFSLPKATTGGWFKLNFNATGYYRVDYQLKLNADGSVQQQQPRQQQPMSLAATLASASASMPSTSNQQQPVDMLARLAGAVKSKSMCVIDRFNLVDDLFAMVKSGKKPTAYYLRYLIENFDEEREIIVLRSIVESLKRIKAIVSNADVRLNSLFDRYVREYFRRLLSFAASGNSSSSSGTGRSKDTHQLPLQLHKQQQSNAMSSSPSSSPSPSSPIAREATRNNQPTAAKKVEDLIDATKAQFNDQKFQLAAANLFSRHFRSLQLGARNGPSLDSMDREMRAAVYSAVLAGSSDVDLTPTDELLLVAATGTVHAPNVQPATLAAQDSLPSLLLGAHSSLSSIFAPTPPPASTVTDRRPQQQLVVAATPQQSSSSSSSADHHHQQPLKRQDVFLKLLRAYASSEASSERYAICSALGSVRLPNKQLKLLNLTLFEAYFRQHDSLAILDAMARTKQGRQTLWEALKSNIEAIERRQLLAPLLRSLANSGLIENSPTLDSDAANANSDVASSMGGASGTNDEMKNYLRLLYQQYSNDYGKYISQLIEFISINSQWFKRDHDGILQYLEAAGFDGDEDI